MSPSPVKFVVRWEEPEGHLLSASIFVHHDGGVDEVGEIFFNGNEWTFIPLLPMRLPDREAEPGAPTATEYLDIDPEVERAHRDQEANLRVGASHAELAPRLEALRVSQRLYRDETRDLAEIGGIIRARHWWRRLT